MENKRFQLPLNLGRFDFTNWIVGLVSAFISGGAGAFLTGTGIMVTDPVYFTSHPWTSFRVYILTFLSTGVFSMMNFLHQQPFPKTLISSTTVKEDGSGGKETTKIQVQSQSDLLEPQTKDGTKE